MLEYRLWPIFTMISYLCFAGVTNYGFIFVLPFVYFCAYRTIRAAVKEFAHFRGGVSLNYFLYIVLIMLFTYIANSMLFGEL